MEAVTRMDGAVYRLSQLCCAIVAIIPRKNMHIYIIIIPSPHPNATQHHVLAFFEYSNASVILPAAAFESTCAA